MKEKNKATLIIESNGSAVIRLSPGLTRVWQESIGRKTTEEINSDCEPSGCTLSLSINAIELPDVDVYFDGELLT